MTRDTGPTDPRGLWQTDTTAPLHLSAEELRARSERLARTTRRRNLGGLACCAIVFAGCIWWLVQVADPLARIGALLTVVGIGTLAFQLRSDQGSEQAAVRRATMMGGSASVDFHRGELERQRDFHSGRRLWTRLLMFAPGPLLFFAGFARAHPEVGGTIRLEALAFALFLLAAVPLNLRLARTYQRRLDELDRLQKEPK
jgi:hypothetical protein